MLDIAQNSVRAGSRLIEIMVDEQPESDTMTITVADDGCGMTPEQAAHVTDPFFTTRTTRRVGLGVPFLKMAAEMTGGGLTIETAPGRGTTVRAVFGLTHIDRMPLGDIAATICSLIQCNPEIDFTYTYRRGESSFTADTREVGGGRGEVRLTNPEEVALIGSFIRESTQEITAQAQ